MADVWAKMKISEKSTSLITHIVVLIIQSIDNIAAMIIFVQVRD